jgi:hypothetical protein
MREWLPADHLAWFVMDAVAEMDLSAFYAAYRADGHGRAALSRGDSGMSERSDARAIARDQSPNQRARLVAPNSSFSAAYSRVASYRWAAAAGPLRKLTSTLLTSPSPNSA